MSERVEKFLREQANVTETSTPRILNLQESVDRAKLSRLISDRKIQHVVDDYREQQRELFQVRNPTRVYTADFELDFSGYIETLERDLPLWQHGNWVYFPWVCTVVHLLDDEEFQLVRTARNRNLITQEEQEKFYDAVVGIGGLSVGNSVALAIVLQGGARHIRLADHDRFALSNTNRVRAGVENLGLPKAEMTARQIYQLNPYATVDLFPEGLTQENIPAFFEGPPRLDIVVDEVDDLETKILLREHARKHRLPVLMGADNGDNAIVEIERHDLDPELDYFHGRLGKVARHDLSGLDKFGAGKVISKMLGAETITPRAQRSLLEVGKTLVSWPQLGGAALMNGCAIAYCVRKIANGQPVEANRAFLSLDEKLSPNYHDPQEVKKRKVMTTEFKRTLGL
jgi:tRNA A37 threonylcarbamoyladenosine dehydratase